MKACDFLDAPSISFLENNRPGGIEWLESVINHKSFKFILKYYKPYDYHCTEPEFNGTHVIFLHKKPNVIVPSTIGIYIDDALESLDPELKGTYIKDNNELIIFQPWIIDNPIE